MLTDAPPRKQNRAGFMESDWIRMLDLPPPQNKCLLTIAQSIDLAMKAGATADVRRACSDFLKAASEFYEVPGCGIRVFAAWPGRVTQEEAKFHPMWPAGSTAEATLFDGFRANAAGE